MRRGPAEAPQHDADAGEQLFKAEGLREVVVGPDGEAGQAVVQALAGGEEDDGGTDALGLQPAADVEAVEVGHHHVEHDEVGPELRHRGQGRPPAVADLNLETLVPEAHGEELTDVLFVVHYQDANRSVHAHSFGHDTQSNLRARCVIDQCPSGPFRKSGRPRGCLSMSCEAGARSLVPGS